MSYQKRFDLIAFDADDTLWHEEVKYQQTERKLLEMLGRYVSAETVREHLHKVDVRNLRYFGYGVKGFVLSMIETAIEITDGRITGEEIQYIVNWGRDMLVHPIECFPHVETALANLYQSHKLIVITKGDLLDQETKIARSGLADYFDHVEVVSNKRSESYRTILDRHGVTPERFLMVGNALRSDIVPVVEIGGSAVFIPSGFSWAHEEVRDVDKRQFAQLDHIGQLPTYVWQLEGRSG